MTPARRPPPAAPAAPARGARERAIELLDPRRSPAAPTVRDGYLDLLGGVEAIGPHPGQRWMASRTLPLIYERLWRPLGGKLLMGAAGPDMNEERRLALRALELEGSERVLDVGCGPGNLTRAFAPAAAAGTVVGLDASPTMLARAVAETGAHNVAYVRADASALPFRDGSFDAVSCWAALYLIEDPQRALTELVRVLAPGGRLAVLSSCHRGPLPLAVARPVVKALTGVRMFGRDELTDALVAEGMTGVRARVSGLAQVVSARKAPSPRRARRR
jgi:SAM-dependent methyltransferase